MTTPNDTGEKELDITKEAEKLMRIGMLRQWLNEERIKDGERFVTNEDIMYWLDLITKEEYQALSNGKEE